MIVHLYRIVFLCKTSGKIDIGCMINLNLPCCVEGLRSGAALRILPMPNHVRNIDNVDYDVIIDRVLNL